MPDTVSLGGTRLQLNGIGLRTYSLVGIRIYVAALYLDHTSADAEAILNSPGKKLLMVHFLHDVDVEHARQAWRDGFDGNCRPPCRLAPSDVDRFLASVPAMRAGDVSSLAFHPGGLDVTMNGRTVGQITDPAFARAILATFLGPNPPTARLKRELLGQAE